MNCESGNAGDCAQHVENFVEMGKCEHTCVRLWCTLGNLDRTWHLPLSVRRVVYVTI
jgi:hypothetical protein